MTIDEAIKIIAYALYVDSRAKDSNLKQALELGIEALKAWKQFKEGRWMSGRYDLPGETEE